MENISFVMLQASLLSPSGRTFIKKAQSAGRQVISWTVNDECDLDWTVKHKLDSVITDDPRKFSKLMDNSDSSKPSAARPFSKVFGLVRVNILVGTFSFLFGLKHGYGLDRRFSNIDSRTKTS